MGLFKTAVAVYLLLYACTKLTLTKHFEDKLYINYLRMRRALMNKSWKQHPTINSFTATYMPSEKTFKIRRTRHVGRCWRSKYEFISEIFLALQYMKAPVLADM